MTVEALASTVCFYNKKAFMANMKGWFLTMRKILALALAMIMIALTLTSCGGIDATKDYENVLKNGKIVVGMECAYAPYNWTVSAATEHTVPIANNPGAYADGYDVQIAKLIASNLGVELEIVAIEWGGLIAALESGQIDLIIAGMSPTAEREEEVDFTNCYYNSNLVIIYKKN
jgi:putative lysine transport system permease protein